MHSPALRNRSKVLARKAAIEAGAASAEGSAPPMADGTPVSDEYRKLLAAMHEDLRALSTIQSIEARIGKKQKMIDAYRPWCLGALEIEEGATAPQDEIVVQTMIWALDISDWGFALDLAEHCITHNLVPPERFNRTTACLVAEDIAERAIKTPDSVPHDILERARPGAGQDMPDQARAKYHRALGESWARQAEEFDPNAESAFAGGKPALIDAALGELRRGVELNARVGVKKLIQQLERDAKVLAEEAEAAADKNKDD